MMTFTTPQFVFTMLTFLICWHLLPHIVKKPALLLFSYYYAYLLGGFWTIGVLAAATVLTYFWAFLLAKSSHKKILLFLYIFIFVALLIYEKDTAVLIETASKFIDTGNFTLKVVNMIGVSYYVLSAMAYIIDIYRGKETPDKNLIDLAVWLVFFPKIIAGPIERHAHFKNELDRITECKFDFERIKRGLLICARGYFYKIMIADRIANFVNIMFPNASDYHGFILFFAMIACSIQIYCDFAGYSLIAYGIAYAIDIRITNNFNLPFFSASIRELWKRWHISFSAWIKDYIYIPLGGSRKGKIRQYINLLISFVISGAWHGPGVNYMIWGGLNGVFQIFEQLVLDKIKIPKFIRIIITFLQFSFAVIFFRADTFQNAKIFIKRMLTIKSVKILAEGDISALGLDIKDWYVLFISFGIAFIGELLQYKGISLYKTLQSKNIVIRWTCYYAIIVILTVFGIYGNNFDINNFIYFNF